MREKNYVKIYVRYVNVGFIVLCDLLSLYFGEFFDMVIYFLVDKWLMIYLEYMDMNDL